jgi:hypothetical protein
MKKEGKIELLKLILYKSATQRPMPKAVFPATKKTLKREETN